MIGNLRNMANDMGAEVSDHHQSIIINRLSSIDHHQLIIINRANYRDNQVHKQNDQLDRINKKAESDKMRVKIANDKAQALLK